MSIMYIEALPMSLQTIEASAWRFRVATGTFGDPWLDVPRMLEFGVPIIFGENAHFSVLDPDEMGQRHALADPDGKVILVRSDVYDGACSGRGRDRMTVMHEIGHLVLHSGISLARRMSAVPPPAYRDPEWQAKAWAGAVMVPRRLVRDPEAVTASVVAREFGVSCDAAEYRLRQLRLRQRA